MEITVSIYETVMFVLTLLLVTLYFKIYKNDTSAESIFFTIDTSRTMRFMIAYMVVLNFTVIGLLFTFPLLVLGLIATIVLILFLVGNILIFILNLVLFLFGSQFSFIGIDFLLSLTQTNFRQIIKSYYFDGFLVLQFIFTVFAPLFSGRQIGKYAEDAKSILITGMVWSIFFGSQLYFFKVFNIDSGDLLIIDYVELVILISFGLYFLSARGSYNSKLEVDNYELPEIKGFKSYIYFIVGYLPLIFIVGLGLLIGSTEFFEVNDTELINIGLAAIIMAIEAFFTIFIILFYLRGDHPLHQKITELEMREELLEMAKEFRELDPSNIDDFVKKSSSKLI